MIRTIVSDVVSTHTAEMNGRLNVLHSQLLAIKEQTTKTNGRVTKTEEIITSLQLEEASHLSKCPNMKRIESLESDQSERGGAMKFVRFAGWILFSISSLIIAYMELVKK